MFSYCTLFVPQNTAFWIQLSFPAFLNFSLHTLYLFPGFYTHPVPTSARLAVVYTWFVGVVHMPAEPWFTGTARIPCCKKKERLLRLCPGWLFAACLSFSYFNIAIIFIRFNLHQFLVKNFCLYIYEINKTNNLYHQIPRLSTYLLIQLNCNMAEAKTKISQA